VTIRKRVRIPPEHCDLSHVQTRWALVCTRMRAASRSGISTCGKMRF